jgi:hypothetical protein
MPRSARLSSRSFPILIPLEESLSLSSLLSGLSYGTMSCDVADSAALHVFYRGCKYCFIIDADFEETSLSPEQFAFEEE